VAKDSGGIKAHLINLEKTAFGDFWSKWKDVGVKIEIISQAADELKIDITIVRDRMILDENNNLIRDNAVNPITAAIDGYSDFLEFDGKLMLSKLVDAIQAAEGVIDVKLTAAWHRPFGGSWTAVDMSIESVAGYFQLNYDASNFTWIDNVEVSVFD
jgi:hypothetical protein